MADHQNGWPQYLSMFNSLKLNLYNTLELPNLLSNISQAKNFSASSYQIIHNTFLIQKTNPIEILALFYNNQASYLFIYYQNSHVDTHPP